MEGGEEVVESGGMERKGGKGREEGVEETGEVRRGGSGGVEGVESRGGRVGRTGTGDEGRKRQQLPPKASFDISNAWNLVLERG